MASTAHRAQPARPPLDPRISDLRDRGAAVGEGVFLGPDVYVELDFAPLLTIEDGVVLARGACVLLHDSALNNVAGEPLKFGAVTLRRGCYIGANSTLLCGVEVGPRAVVGACSLVTADIPADMYAFGQPARPRGPVRALVERHRRQAVGGGRYLYLPAPPWRERETAEDHERVAWAIGALLDGARRDAAEER